MPIWPHAYNSPFFFALLFIYIYIHIRIVSQIRRCFISCVNTMCVCFFFARFFCPFNWMVLSPSTFHIPLYRASFNRVRLIHHPFASMLTSNLLATHGISLRFGFGLSDFPTAIVFIVPCLVVMTWSSFTLSIATVSLSISSSLGSLTSMLVFDNDITTVLICSICFNHHFYDISTHRDCIYHRVLITFLLAQRRR